MEKIKVEIGLKLTYQPDVLIAFQKAVIEECKKQPASSEEVLQIQEDIFKCLNVVKRISKVEFVD